MQKLLTGLAVAFALSASAAQACEFHNTTASTPNEEVVAMSSEVEPVDPIVIVSEPTSPNCPAGQANCEPAGN
jgi:hypothetical protein